MKIREYSGYTVLFCIVCFVSANRSLFAELQQPLFAPNLHYGIDWDTEPSGTPGMELVKTGKTSIGEISIYKNSRETLNYEGIEFSSIEYGFNNKELLFVAYKASGTDNWAAFKKVAIENYGAGFVRYENGRYNNYIWNISGYSVALEYDTVSKSSILLIVSG